MWTGRGAIFLALIGMLSVGCGTSVPDPEEGDDASSPSPTVAAAGDTPSPPGVSSMPAGSPEVSPTAQPPTPTPSSADTSTPTPAPDVSPSPTPLPVLEPSPTPEPTPTAAPTPTGTPVPFTVGQTCPSGMSAVYLIDPTDILYCIDTYEDTYEGPLGALDQYDQSGQRTTATSQSLAGVEPGTAISYDQAVATCANTPVTSSDGTVLGYKRLATSQEWIDAGDGQPGTGGSRYIYGSNFNASRCATLNSQGGQQYPTTQLTGSLPGCVSRFGVFDQSGNAWEWTNPQMNISISDWFTLANENSLEMRVDEGGLIVSDSMTVAPVLTFDMAGVSPSTVSQDSEGYLFINSNQVNPGSIDFKGYLKMSLAAVPYNGEDNFLPVKLSSIDPADPTAPFRVLLLVDDDGAPIPDKRGAAYYAGNSDDCSNYSAHYNHFHDFNGTISFRCVSAPILDFPVP